MSTHSSTRTRAVYGTSAVDVNSLKHTSSRRDSTAPLMSTPPISVNIRDDPLESSSLNRGSCDHHMNNQRMGLWRRRRNSESSDGNDDDDDDDDDNDNDDVDKNKIELNTSDEEQSESDEEDEEENTAKDMIPRLTGTRINEFRIHGLNNIAKDTNDEQLLLLEDEDVEIYIMGYTYNRVHLLLYQLCSLLSLGIVWLIARWVPKWYISWVGVRVPLKEAEWLVFKK
ncbi:P5-type ATPase cation transporter-domain-containing protein [Cokeromyces recurvatus]|uniref:P5-type ATPase cation transporter-domain-containing protein n=1 Tax=Cokeromyces recurvatus TaxID=90255 RepID=UPI00221EFED9|nr:P5-type ATPase cation transporter-domain-containing protein [Cokeromyces recurvatus]KAI7905261.1 P5-type ATPase cation transporter-domain-containing protein [Cokeromyces recurvatus]